MADPAKIRAQLEGAQRELAHAQGEQDTLQKEIDQNMAKLRQQLGCKPGEEREAVQKLRQQIEADESELAKLLDEVETMQRSTT